MQALQEAVDKQALRAAGYSEDYIAEECKYRRMQSLVLDEFVEAFPQLCGTARWEGFSYIVADQLKRESVGIIETGTCRQPGNWAGDGCATKVWDWLVERKGGWACSVDIDIHACLRAQDFCPHVQVVCADSVTFLRGMLPGPPTLLYLDSFDYPEPIEQRKASMMHQAAELASVYAKLPSGCLIASDDSIAVDHGKPGLTRRMLEAFGIKPVVDSYIVVWRKP